MFTMEHAVFQCVGVERSFRCRTHCRANCFSSRSCYLRCLRLRRVAAEEVAADLREVARLAELHLAEQLDLPALVQQAQEQQRSVASQDRLTSAALTMPAMILAEPETRRKLTRPAPIPPERLIHRDRRPPLAAGQGVRQLPEQPVIRLVEPPVAALMAPSRRARGCEVTTRYVPKMPRIPRSIKRSKVSAKGAEPLCSSREPAWDERGPYARMEPDALSRGVRHVNASSNPVDASDARRGSGQSKLLHQVSCTVVRFLCLQI
jgi:hypothetical protein